MVPLQTSAILQEFLKKKKDSTGGQVQVSSSDLSDPSDLSDLSDPSDLSDLSDPSDPSDLSDPSDSTMQLFGQGLVTDNISRHFLKSKKAA
jgi:hypothetical protein